MTVQSNLSADRVRKNILPSYFADAAWTSNYIDYFCNALEMSSPNRVDLVKVSIFYMSEKMSGQTFGR